MNSNLSRFLDAQQQTYQQAYAEVQAGEKQTHWMWYIFPQLKGLGVSNMSEFYGITGSDEAMAYLAHPILGSRLREICQLLMESHTDSAVAIFGTPDYLKLHSCLTLFAMVEDDDDSIFNQVINKFFGGNYDQETVSLLLN